MDLNDIWRIYELDGMRTLVIENTRTHQEICTVQLPYVDTEDDSRCRVNAELIRMIPFLLRATLGMYGEEELKLARKKLSDNLPRFRIQKGDHDVSL